MKIFLRFIKSTVEVIEIDALPEDSTKIDVKDWKLEKI